MKTLDKRLHTTTEKLTIKFHGRTAKANANFLVKILLAKNLDFHLQI